MSCESLACDPTSKLQYLNTEVKPTTLRTRKLRGFGAVRVEASNLAMVCGSLSLRCVVVAVEFREGGGFVRLRYDFLLIVTEDGAAGNNLGAVCRAVSWLPVLSAEVFPSHGGVPVVLDCVFGATGYELGYVSPPVAEFVVGHDESFLFFSAPAVSLQLTQRR